MDRKYSFAVLLIVVSVSVVFGMIVGGRLNAPSTMLAADEKEWLRAPAEASAAMATAGSGPVSFADIAEAALPAVVGVRNVSIQKSEDPHLPFQDDPLFRRFFGPAPDPDTERRSVGFGSGFIISEDGYILTNYHVVEDETRLTVELKSGQKYEAAVIGSDPSIDMALIKIDPKGEPLPTLTLGDSGGLRVGEWVLAIGNPLGLDYTVTVGVVSAKARNFQIGSTLPGVASFIQTDAAINRGNSGGPLLNSRGQVVGINTAIFRGGFNSALVEGVGFALPINAARDAVQQLLETGSVERGFLGITMNLTPIDEDARDYYGLPDTSGVMITDVQDGWPAQKAGVRKGDIIRKVNGEPVRDNSELLSKIAGRRPGESVDLEIFRGGKTFEYTVTLESRDAGLRARAGDEDSAPQDELEDDRPGTGLGIEVENLTPTIRERLELGDDVQGVIVTEVDVSSVAADKGLTPRMIITGINDKSVGNVSDWNRMMRKLEVGDLVKVELRLGSQTSVVFLRVAEEGD